MASGPGRASKITTISFSRLTDRSSNLSRSPCSTSRVTSWTMPVSSLPCGVSEASAEPRTWITPPSGWTIRCANSRCESLESRKARKLASIACRSAGCTSALYASSEYSNVASLTRNILKSSGDHISRPDHTSHFHIPMPIRRCAIRRLAVCSASCAAADSAAWRRLASLCSRASRSCSRATARLTSRTETNSARRPSHSIGWAVVRTRKTSPDLRWWRTVDASRQ